jgi:transaldolase
MKLFLDTANVNEIKPFLDTGLIDGITTNPTLIAKSGRNVLDVIQEMCELVDGPISAEVIATDAKGMLEEAKKLTAISPNVTIKVPLTPEGLKACYALSQEGTLVNVTLCFSAGQALLAAKAGATFVSPFIGRLDDIAFDGLQLIEEIATLYQNDGDIDTLILAASIRHPLHVTQAAQCGADIATLPPQVLAQLFKHPLTDKGLETFLADWAQSGQKIA